MFIKSLVMLSVLTYSFLNADIATSINKSECNSYLEMNQQELFKSMSSNLSGENLNIAPMCKVLVQTLSKADNSNDMDKITSLQEANEYLKEFAKFNINVKSVGTAINNEYKLLNKKLKNTTLIDINDNTTVYLNLNVDSNGNYTVYKVNKVRDSIINSNQSLSKEQLVSSYPLLAQSKGITIEAYSNIIENVDDVNELKYTLLKGNVNLRREPTSVANVILEQKLKKGTTVYGIIGSLDNEQVVGNDYLNVYFKTKEGVVRCWISSKYLEKKSSQGGKDA